ncbi:hypothetical protein WBG78_19255 [Chryseolinea sp. T2]|uniref:hypothetical protein n=1 Tax=Chryseolinea sp. T2 TaxID=3129255 RepID=UPI0030785CCC
MATQDGIIQLKGRVGNISFYKTKDGYAARKASGVDGVKVKNDDRFVRTRENMKEFEQASKATMAFRAAFAHDVKIAGDGGLARRLTSLFHKLLRQDAVNGRGSRQVLPVTTKALEGLQFNDASSLTKAHKVPFTPLVNRATGNVSVEISAFSPLHDLSKPDGATHFVLRSTAAEIDFETQKYVAVTAQTAPIAVDSGTTGGIALQHLIPGATKPLILTFGINFIQIVNGIEYALKSGLHSVMQVVKVDTGIAV